MWGGWVITDWGLAFALVLWDAADGSELNDWIALLALGEGRRWLGGLLLAERIPEWLGSRVGSGFSLLAGLRDAPDVVG